MSLDDIYRPKSRLSSVMGDLALGGLKWFVNGILFGLGWFAALKTIVCFFSRSVNSG